MYALDPSTPEPKVSPVPKDLVVGLDTPCALCGYVLRGLRTSATCPECNTPVDRSVMRDKLRHAPVEIVRRFRLGARLARVAAFIVIVADLAIGAIIAVAWVASGAWGFLPAAFLGVIAGTPLIAGSIGFAGWWLLTSSEIAPGDRPRERRRRAVRISACALAAAWLMASGPMVAGMFRALPPGAYLPLIDLAAIAACGATGVLLFVLPRRVRDLGDRCENEEISGALPAHDLLASFAVLALGMLALGVWLSQACLAIVGGLGSVVVLPLLMFVQAGMLRSLAESLAGISVAREASRR